MVKLKPIYGAVACWRLSVGVSVGLRIIFPGWFFPSLGRKTAYLGGSERCPKVVPGGTPAPSGSLSGAEASRREEVQPGAPPGGGTGGGSASSAAETRARTINTPCSSGFCRRCRLMPLGLDSETPSGPRPGRDRSKDPGSAASVSVGLAGGIFGDRMNRNNSILTLLAINCYCD